MCFLFLQESSGTMRLCDAVEVSLSTQKGRKLQQVWMNLSDQDVLQSCTQSQLSSIAYIHYSFPFAAAAAACCICSWLLQWFHSTQVYSAGSDPNICTHQYSDTPVYQRLLCIRLSVHFGIFFMNVLLELGIESTALHN